jgi:deoxyuridine 5'-triphosphate nucleotidohydrolase
MNLTAKIKLDDGATMPTRATDGSVGYDVRAKSATLINLNGWEQTYVKGFDLNRFIHSEGSNGSYVRIRPDFKRIILDTGIRVAPPDGYYFELVPNSRLAKTGLVYGNSFGVIDPDYTGTIKCVLTVTSAATMEDMVRVMPPQVIGQLILRKKYDVDFTQVDALDETERGEGGFGSTERKV